MSDVDTNQMSLLALGRQDHSNSKTLFLMLPPHPRLSASVKEIAWGYLDQKGSR